MLNPTGYLDDIFIIKHKKNANTRCHCVNSIGHGLFSVIKAIFGKRYDLE